VGYLWLSFSHRLRLLIKQIQKMMRTDSLIGELEFDLSYLLPICYVWLAHLRGLLKVHFGDKG
jgi:hypothetical protein